LVANGCGYERQTLCNEVATMENQKIATIAKKLGGDHPGGFTRSCPKLGDEVATELLKRKRRNLVDTKGGRTF